MISTPRPAPSGLRPLVRGVGAGQEAPVQGARQDAGLPEPICEPKLLGRYLTVALGALHCDAALEVAVDASRGQDPDLHRLTDQIGIGANAVAKLGRPLAREEVTDGVLVEPFDRDALFGDLGEEPFLDQPAVGHGGDVGDVARIAVAVLVQTRLVEMHGEDQRGLAEG